MKHGVGKSASRPASRSGNGAGAGGKPGGKAGGATRGRPNLVSRGAAKPPSQRQIRVAEEIRHVLSGIFGRGEIHDPDLSDVLITVTEVRIGPDLKRATAFVTRLGRSDIEQKLPALRRAAPFLRTLVAKAMRLRVAPDLSFQADTSIDYAMYVDGLLRAPDVARDLAAATEVKSAAPSADDPQT